MSIFFFERLAEKRIQEAIRQGQFENLPGRGKPIIFEDDSMVPQDLRMAYKMLKNAGFIPPELQTEKEIKNALDLLDDLQDERERYRQVTKLNILVTKANMLRSRPINLEVNQVYYRKVVEKIKVRKR